VEFLTKNINDATFISDGGTTKRSFAARFADQVNVKDFGATGDGSTNDRTAIQAAFDAAFGSSGSPHSVDDAQDNRTVVFPFGRYVINSGLTLTQVYGGYIKAPHGTKLLYTPGSGTALAINGMQNTRIEGLAINSTSSGIGIALDWDGTGDVGLSNNTFHGVHITGGPATGIRIAAAGNEGDTTKFYNCVIEDCSSVGLLVTGANAQGCLLVDTHAIDCAIGVQVVGGAVFTANNAEFSGNTSWDFVFSNSASRPNLSGISSTSSNFCSLAGDGALALCEHTGTGTFVAMASGAKVVMDICTSAGNVTGAGSLYRIFSSVGTTGFSGTSVQTIT
jgi:hypothetical protein